MQEKKRKKRRLDQRVSTRGPTDKKHVFPLAVPEERKTHQPP